MILEDLKELKKLEAARRQPSLCFMGFSLLETLRDVWIEHFNDVPLLPEIFFVDRGPLACIYIGPSPAVVYVHSLLNHPATPKEAISLICKHELLHIRIRPRCVNGRLQQHPPEFREAEESVAPERVKAWEWILRARGRWIRDRPKLERTDVLYNWREVWDAEGLPARVEDLLSKDLRIEAMLREGRLRL